MNKHNTSRRQSIGAFSYGLKMKLSAFLFIAGLFQINANTYTLTTEIDQQFQVSGTVTDGQGVPLGGANVMEKGTANGVITDFDGNFSLNVSNANATLVFSYIGFGTKEVAVASKNTIKVQMEESASGLDEVVVVGYGTQIKKDLTGATSSVKGEELTRAPTANLASNLGGKMTGVFVNSATGQPGAEDINFAIRGVSTSGNNDPLVLVDGIVRSFARIDPNDIESITVLKDAASTAVYGARAANGVILVTTKRGRSGKASFEFQSSFGFQSQIRKVELMDVGEYATYINEAKLNYGENPIFTDAEVKQYVDGELPGYNWLDAVLSNSAPIARYDISASGGSENTKYFVSYGLLDQKGFYSTASYKQHNLRSNIDIALTDRLDLTLDLSGRIENRSESPSSFSSIYQGALIGKPYLNPLLDREVGPGALAPNGLGGSPLGSAERSGNKTRLSDILQSTIKLKYRVPGVEGLTASALYSYDLTFRKLKEFRKPFTQYEYNGAKDSYDETRGGFSTISLSERRELGDQQTLQLSMNYDKVFGKHKFGALALFEQTESKDNFLEAFRDNFISTQLPELFAGGTELWSNDGSSNETARRGYIGRIEYNYDSRYLFQGNIRVDQSFNFPTEGRTGVFPAFSLGWRISEEDFMQNATFINDLKLRGSWGQVGNDRVPAFQYLSLFEFDGGYVYNQSYQQGINSSGIPNPNITWETATTYDLGLDLDILDGKLGFEFDYFKKRTEDILRPNNEVVPGTFGASLPDINFGVVDSWGGEVLVKYKETFGDFRFNANANASWYQNKAIELAEPAGILSSIAQTGKSLGLRYGYLSDGLFQNQDEINNAPTQFSQAIQNGLRPGDIRYKDINGRDTNGNLTGQPDGKIDADDRSVIGSSGNPRLIFGLNLSLNYKGFDLSTSFQGASNYSRYLQSITFERDVNSLKEHINAWRPGSENARYPRLKSGDASANSKVDSDFWVSEVSYLKLRNLEIGYNFSGIEEELKSLGVASLRVYASGTNLLTISNLGWRDPEGPSNSALYYPQTKTLTFGFNLGF